MVKKEQWKIMLAFYKCPKKKLILFIVNDKDFLKGRDTTPEEVYGFLIGKYINLEWKTRYVLVKNFLIAMQRYTQKLLGISQASSVELLSFNYFSSDHSSSKILSNINDDDVINVFI
jgi:hypothetical protein